MPLNAKSALLQFSSTSVALHLGQSTQGDSGEIGGQGRGEGGGASGEGMHDIAVFAPFGCLHAHKHAHCATQMIMWTSSRIIPLSQAHHRIIRLLKGLQGWSLLSGSTEP